MFTMQSNCPLVIVAGQSHDHACHVTNAECSHKIFYVQLVRKNLFFSLFVMLAVGRVICVPLYYLHT